MQFIPPYQDAPTLCRNLCICENTLGKWVREGRLPPARMIGGKRMWKWSEVEESLAEPDCKMTGIPTPEEIRNATKKLAASKAR